MSRNNKPVKKNKVKARNMRLAVAPLPNPPQQSKKAVLADNPNYNTADYKGRKSLIEELKVYGIWVRVLAMTRRYRKDNPDSSYKDLYMYLRESFPNVFDNENIYGSNFRKVVESNKDWSDAYWSYKGDIDDRVDLQLSMMLNRDNLSESTIVKLYELQLKKKAAEQIPEDDNNTIVFGFED